MVQTGIASEYVSKHVRIISALMARELATRYGRDNIGFLWIIGEPLLFGSGVLFIWNIIRPPYEHGVRLVPFLFTGYFPLLVIRHVVGHGMHAIAANTNLLYHKTITLLHLFIARSLLETCGVTLAAMLVGGTLVLFGIMEPPQQPMILYAGWFALCWNVIGLTMIFGALTGFYEPLEKIGNLFTYILMPISGMFYMVAWLPYQYRDLALHVPFLNCVEMIRRGVFGDDVETHFRFGYAMAFGSIMIFIGLVLLSIIRERIEVE